VSVNVLYIHESVASNEVSAGISCCMGSHKAPVDSKMKSKPVSEAGRCEEIGGIVVKGVVWGRAKSKSVQSVQLSWFDGSSQLSRSEESG